MAYITASEIQEGLTRLRIPMISSPCDPRQWTTLVGHDRQRVTVGGREGVLISYHLADPSPDDNTEVIVAFSYPELHRRAPDQIQLLIGNLFIPQEVDHERDRAITRY